MEDVKAEILSRLLGIQNAVDTLPDEEAIATFLRRALAEAPGVAKAAVCLRGVLYPPDPPDTDFEDARRCCAGNKDIPEALAGCYTGAGRRVLPVATPRHSYGFLGFSLGNAQAFEPYVLFLEHVAGLVAHDLERRDQLAEIAAAKRKLEAQCAKHAETLRLSEERFGAIARNAQDAIIMIGAQDNIVFWNAAAERILGYTAEEAAGKHVHEFITPERFREQAEKGLQEFRQSGQGPVIGKTLELAAIRKDGAEIPIEIAVAAIKGENEWRAVAVLRDISERKQAEEALQLKVLQQNAIAELGALALNSRDLTTCLGEAVKLIASTLDVELCAILEQRSETMDLLLQHGVGWEDGVVGHATVTLTDGYQARYVLQAGAPVIVNDLQS